MSEKSVIRLYHGGPVENFVPTFGLGRDQHDYGRGFYLTESVRLAKEWAVAANTGEDGWLHVYDLDLEGLEIIDFREHGSLAWLAELMKHREADESRYYRENAPKFIAKYGIDISKADVVTGWRANASYFYIAKSLVRNNIGIDFLKDLLKLGDFGIQYFIRSEKSFARLTEIESLKERVPSQDFHGLYANRDNDARLKMYDLIENDPRNELKWTFKDVI